MQKPQTDLVESIVVNAFNKTLEDLVKEETES